MDLIIIIYKKKCTKLCYFQPSLPSALFKLHPKESFFQRNRPQTLLNQNSSVWTISWKVMWTTRSTCQKLDQSSHGTKEILNTVVKHLSVLSLTLTSTSPSKLNSSNKPNNNLLLAWYHSESTQLLITSKWSRTLTTMDSYSPTNSELTSQLLKSTPLTTRIGNHVATPL